MKLFLLFMMLLQSASSVQRPTKGVFNLSPSLLQGRAKERDSYFSLLLHGIRVFSAQKKSCHFTDPQERRRIPLTQLNQRERTEHIRTCFRKKTLPYSKIHALSMAGIGRLLATKYRKCSQLLFYHANLEVSPELSISVILPEPDHQWSSSLCCCKPPSLLCFHTFQMWRQAFTLNLTPLGMNYCPVLISFFQHTLQPLYFS